jgi:outer membrane protein/adhesin transport system outer membrane protein
MYSGKARISVVVPRLAGLAVALALSAAPVAAQTLEETLARAYETNPSLQASRAQLRATDNTVSEALAGWRPTVTLNASAGKRSVDQNGDTDSEVRTPKNGSLLVEQNLFSGFGTQYGTRRAEYNVHADRARLLATEQDVLLAAATAYMDVLRDQAVLELNTNNERVLQRQREAANDRFQVGEVTRTDVAQAESRLSRANADRIRAEGDLISSRARYRSTVGEMPGRLRPTTPLGGLPANEDSVLSLARNNAPDVAVARFTEQAAQATVGVVTSERYPELDLEAEVGRTDQATSRFSRTDSASIIAVVRVPLYQGGAVSARVREAKEIASQRRQELDLAVRSAVQEGTSAWEALQTARAQIKAFSEEVRAAEIALEGVRQEAAVGSRTVLDVLDAEQELLDARVSLVQAQRDEVVASFSLRAAVGELTARNLNLPVQGYDYEEHYKAVRGKFWGTSIEGE